MPLDKPVMVKVIDGEMYVPIEACDELEKQIAARDKTIAKLRDLCECGHAPTDHESGCNEDELSCCTYLGCECNTYEPRYKPWEKLADLKHSRDANAKICMYWKKHSYDLEIWLIKKNCTLLRQKNRNKYLERKLADINDIVKTWDHEEKSGVIDWFIAVDIEDIKKIKEVLKNNG